MKIIDWFTGSDVLEYEHLGSPSQYIIHPLILKSPPEPHDWVGNKGMLFLGAHVVRHDWESMELFSKKAEGGFYIRSDRYSFHPAFSVTNSVRRQLYKDYPLPLINHLLWNGSMRYERNHVLAPQVRRSEEQLSTIINTRRATMDGYATINERLLKDQGYDEETLKSLNLNTKKGTKVTRVCPVLFPDFKDPDEVLYIFNPAEFIIKYDIPTELVYFGRTYDPSKIRHKGALPLQHKLELRKQTARQLASFWPHLCNGLPIDQIANPRGTPQFMEVHNMYRDSLSLDRSDSVDFNSFWSLALTSQLYDRRYWLKKVKRSQSKELLALYFGTIPELWPIINLMSKSKIQYNRYIDYIESRLVPIDVQEGLELVHLRPRYYVKQHSRATKIRKNTSRKSKDIYINRALSQKHKLTVEDVLVKGKWEIKGSGIFDKETGEQIYKFTGPYPKYVYFQGERLSLKTLAFCNKFGLKVAGKLITSVEEPKIKITFLYTGKHAWFRIGKNSRTVSVTSIEEAIQEYINYRQEKGYLLQAEQLQSALDYALEHNNLDEVFDI